jgi:SAM-dependent methyltransferase
VGNGEHPSHPVFSALYSVLARASERGDIGERRRHLLAWAHGRVVEIGAGTGLNFRHYPEAVSQVVAIEPDPAMIRRARRVAAEARVPVTLRQAEAEQLPLEDASFDTAVSTLVLCSVGELHASLAELRRVLRPGGRLLFYEHIRADTLRLARWQDRVERPWGWFVGGCHPNRDIVAAIGDAGFGFEDLERLEPRGEMPFTRPHAMGVAVAV